MSKFIDLKGQRFGKWRVVEKGENTNGRQPRWLCLCDCGTISLVQGGNLRNGHSRSCGCLRKELLRKRRTKHGLGNHKLYSVWHGMNDRCNRVNNISYKSYGARGITVCENWRNNFKDFYDWAITNGYARNLQIDRIDNDGNYEPKNCRFVNRKQQSRNRRDNVYCEINGEKKCIAEWAEISGILSATVQWRYKHGVRGKNLLKGVYRE